MMVKVLVVVLVHLDNDRRASVTSNSNGAMQNERSFALLEAARRRHDKFLFGPVNVLDTEDEKRLAFEVFIILAMHNNAKDIGVIAALDCKDSTVHNQTTKLANRQGRLRPGSSHPREVSVGAFENKSGNVGEHHGTDEMSRNANG